MNTNIPITKKAILARIYDEFERSQKIHQKTFRNGNEALGVISEEFDEFKEEIHQNKTGKPHAKCLTEAIQLSAMCYKFIESFWGMSAVKPPCYGNFFYHSADKPCPDCSFLRDCLNETNKD